MLIIIIIGSGGVSIKPTAPPMFALGPGSAPELINEMHAPLPPPSSSFQLASVWLSTLLLPFRAFVFFLRLNVSRSSSSSHLSD